MDILILADGHSCGMVASGATRDDRSAATLPNVLPLDLPHLSRLSWELGSRVVDDATTVGRWQSIGSRWTVSVHDATSETVVVETRTPAGRQRYYGAIRAELDAAIDRLEAAPAWQRTE